MVNRNNVIIHFHDEELMNPKKCAPFFNRKEHTEAFILGCVGDRLNRTLRKQIDEEVKEA